jgi:hypothetical protein
MSVSTYSIVGTESRMERFWQWWSSSRHSCPMGHERNLMQLRGRRFVPTGPVFVCSVASAGRCNLNFKPRWNPPRDVCLDLLLEQHHQPECRCCFVALAIKSFARSKPVGSASSQCDYCRSKLGSRVHLYWHMRFCSLACMSAYQHRLSPETSQKILQLDVHQRTRT